MLTVPKVSQSLIDSLYLAEVSDNLHTMNLEKITAHTYSSNILEVKTDKVGTLLYALPMFSLSLEQLRLSSSYFF